MLGSLGSDSRRGPPSDLIVMKIPEISAAAICAGLDHW
jgi:hypothetical protein